MKRKYYLRGLGIGILITAIVFILVGPSEMTDAEVIKRAEELGYVKTEEEATPTISLKELMETGTPTPSPVLTMIVTPEPSLTETPEETVTPEPTEEPTPTEAVQITETPIPTSEPTLTPTETPIPTETPVPTQVPTPTETLEIVVLKVTIEVERGDTASMVCDKIEAAGILEEGEVLKDYLIEHHLTDYINVGSYTLSSDMSLKKMAEILTKR